MKILIFLHGTIIMHKTAKDQKRKEIVKQVIKNEKSVLDYASYIPIGHAVKKLLKWKSQGADICYLSSHVTSKNVEKDESVLKKHLFPKGNIYYRQKREKYKDVIQRIKPLPDILIEDDCESIGGKDEMAHSQLNQEIKAKIKHIVVKEFGSIDSLPDKIDDFI